MFHMSPRPPYGLETRYVLSAILSSVGLAMPAGLNAWLPFLVLSLADRFTGAVELNGPFAFISSTTGLIVILLLLPIELVADKIPRADRASDLAHSFVRPVAGAILAAAIADASQSVNVWIAALIGGIAAGVTHAAKLRSRPVITRATGGVGNPIASMAEDMVAMISSVVAVFTPILVLLVLPAAGLSLVATWRRLERGSDRLRAVMRPASRR
jgi:uncharacterized membrane protein